MSLKVICASLPILLLPASAHADLEALLGKYATTDGCVSGTTPEFEIRRGIVEGPNLLCILGAPKQAGSGQEAYEAKCTQDGKVHLGVLTLDLTAKDPIKLSLPENKDWIALYRCK